jgi:hypothetical protein
MYFRQKKAVHTGRFVIFKAHHLLVIVHNFNGCMFLRYLFLCLLLYSCSSQRMIQTDLYFGQSKLNGSIVSEKEWSAFVAQYVSKVFPLGSTIIKATGNWYDTAQRQLITEPSNIVISVNNMSPKLNKQIDSLRYWYKTLHQQQSVLRVDKKVKVRLY